MVKTFFLMANGENFHAIKQMNRMNNYYSVMAVIT